MRDRRVLLGFNPPVGGDGAIAQAVDRSMALAVRQGVKLVCPACGQLLCSHQENMTVRSLPRPRAVKGVLFCAAVAHVTCPPEQEPTGRLAVI